MDKQLYSDFENTERILKKTLQEANQFLDQLNERPAGDYPKKPVKSQIPDEGIGAEKALDIFKDKYSDGITGSPGPRYFGFVTGGATPASIAGDWLVSVFDQNVTGSVDSSAPYLEQETFDFFRDLFKLSETHSGAFVTGATMANFTGLAIARQWLAHKQGVNIAQEGLYGLAPFKILSASPHSSIFKALSMLGMGKNSVELMPTLPDREAIDVAELKKRLIDFKEPCVVVANLGTVNTGDFDHLLDIVKLKQEHDFWLHADAAFGGFAACSPKLSHLVEGLDFADSITIDAHKWLNVPYDSAMQFTRYKDLQLEVFQNSAAYLDSSSSEIDYVHLTPENSRRFRALPAWMTLMSYGKKGYREVVERNCKFAGELALKIEQSNNFKLLAPVHLNIVCFTLLRDNKILSAKEIRQFLKMLREDGRIFLTPTIYKGIPAVRAAFSNWRTSAEDVEIAWKALTETFEKFKETKE
ncbi:pyridoxal phosphate-dependent decarboxylase family protein [Scopulibacillus cellulosilyticus]|uniref:Pyridoxal phosphate-dependent decarboxylase family protein n=1 Tax=Scopulibacillus cellulosilyticus TaxID=2665665 RepID=A0ABW2PVK8_9BACL